MSFLCHLKRHPFPVVARLERIVAVSFAFPENSLRPFVPEVLALDTYKGFGFVTVALVWTKKLRPAGVPAFLGQDFFLAGYRIFTRFRDESGHTLRGLRILRSETEKRQMVWLGNLMTRYQYRHITLKIDRDSSETRIETIDDHGATTLKLNFDTPENFIALPEGSPFEDWATARRFAGPMPYTFSQEADGRILVIEGQRQDWVPKPIHVKDWHVSLFNETPLSGIQPILANAFTVENIPYRWKKGHIVHPGGAP